MRYLVMIGLLLAATWTQAGAKEEPNPLAGKWHFVLDTPGGDRDIDADFTVADGKVGGTFGKSEAKGTATAEKFDLEFDLESEEAGKGTMKITGKIGPELSGNWSFQTYDGTFKAKRPKTEP